MPKEDQLPTSRGNFAELKIFQEPTSNLMLHSRIVFGAYTYILRIIYFNKCEEKKSHWHNCNLKRRQLRPHRAPPQNEKSLLSTMGPPPPHCLNEVGPPDAQLGTIWGPLRNLLLFFFLFFLGYSYLFPGTFSLCACVYIHEKNRIVFIAFYYEGTSHT